MENMGINNKSGGSAPVFAMFTEIEIAYSINCTVPDKTNHNTPLALPLFCAMTFWNIWEMLTWLKSAIYELRLDTNISRISTNVPIQTEENYKRCVVNRFFMEHKRQSVCRRDNWHSRIFQPISQPCGINLLARVTFLHDDIKQLKRIDPLYCSVVHLFI